LLSNINRDISPVLLPCSLLSAGLVQLYLPVSKAEKSSAGSLSKTSIAAIQRGIPYFFSQISFVYYSAPGAIDYFYSFLHFGYAVSVNQVKGIFVFGICNVMKSADFHISI